MAKDGMNILRGQRFGEVCPLASGRLSSTAGKGVLFLTPLLKVGGDENGTREERQLSGRVLGAPWTLCVFCAKLLGGPMWFLHCCFGQGAE